MAHCMKSGKGACGHMLKHYEREKDELGEYIKFGNQDIDTSRTDLNYNLAPQREISQMEFVKQRCSEVYCLNRKDVNVMCSWVVTLPKEVSPLDEERFFINTYKFLEDRYGKENVISAYVHKDEITPHVHFAFVPVVYDEKKERYKVSAKDCINKTELNCFHGDLQAHIDQSMGMGIQILNEATRDGNKSIQELKRGTAIEELQNALNEVEKVRDSIKPLEEHKSVLETKIKALEGRILTLEEVKQIDVKKTLTGALKGISYEDVLNLKKTAEQVNNALELHKRTKQMVAEIDKKAIELKQIPLKEQMEKVKLKQDLKKYKDIVDRIPREVIDKYTPNREIHKNRDRGIER